MQKSTSRRYAVTGSATGIGAAIASALRARGDEVIGVDIHDADIIADLGTAAGRADAIRALSARSAGGLDGFIPCAGIGPHVPDATLIPRVNYFGVVQLVLELEARLQERRGAVVLIASESAFNRGYDPRYLEALARDDEDAARARVAALDPDARGFVAYGGAKNALLRWMRHHTGALAKRQVRINALAPGYTETPLTEAGKSGPQAEAMAKYVASIPLGRTGKPRDIAAAALFLLGDEAGFITGATLSVDGGSDAVQRPDRVE